MADYTRSKSIATNAYPVMANGTSGLLKRVEALITPDQLKSRFLKGIFSRLPKDFQYSNEELKDQINLAVNDLELELKTPIFAEQFKERLPFDYNLYKSYIHLRTNAGPILSIEDLAIVSANGENIFRLPSEWIDTGNFHQRLIHVIPLLAAYGTNTIAGSIGNGGVAFLATMSGWNWVPSYWQVIITAGLCKDAGQVPVVVNTLIGIQTAMNILSPLALANPDNSVSIGQDGISQSRSGQGVQIYATRMNDLEKKKMVMLGQLKRIFGQKYFLSNI